MLLFLESIGTGEIVLILLFVLIFFGAKGIPGVARNLGRFIRQVKDAGQGIQDEILKTSTEMRREMNVNKALYDAKNMIEDPMKKITNQLEKSGHQIKNNIEKTLSDKEENKISATDKPKKKTSEETKFESPTPSPPLDQSFD